MGELRSQNQAIRERSEGAIKQSLAGAFEALHTVTARVLQSDDAGWNLRVQNDLQAIRDAVEGARVAAEEALRDMSGKSTEMREEEEKVRLLAMKHRAYLKSLESELPIVQRSENTFWKEAAEAREALTLWNKQVARRKEELHNMVRRSSTLLPSRQLTVRVAELVPQVDHEYCRNETAAEDKTGHRTEVPARTRPDVLGVYLYSVTAGAGGSGPGCRKRPYQPLGEGAEGIRGRQNRTSRSSDSPRRCLQGRGDARGLCPVTGYRFRSSRFLEVCVAITRIGAHGSGGSVCRCSRHEGGHYVRVSWETSGLGMGAGAAPVPVPV